MATESKPLRKDAERNRLRIIEAGREVFARRGLGATLDDVAREAGVGVGTVYRRFPDKDALIDAVLEEGIGDIVAIAEAGLAMEDPWEGLVHFLVEGMALQARNRGLKELVFSSSSGQERTALARERIAPRVVELVERAQAAGVVRADLSPTDMPLMQLAVGTIVDYTADVHPDVWRRLQTIFIDGLRPRRDGASEMPAEPLGFDRLDQVMRAYKSPRR